MTFVGGAERVRTDLGGRKNASFSLTVGFRIYQIGELTGAIKGR